MANEKRLIDANALQLEPDPWGGMNGVICLGRSGGKTMATVQAALKSMIDNAPTVDAVEVVHWRWIRYEHGSGIYCSNCRHKRRYRDAHDNDCPNCGAKMDGDGNG